MSSTSNNERHFEEEEWDDRDSDPLVDNGEPGVKVRALYDYEAAESDELDFKAGKYYKMPIKNRGLGLSILGTITKTEYIRWRFFDP